MPDDRNDNNSQTPRGSLRSRGMPEARSPRVRAGCILFWLARFWATPSLTWAPAFANSSNTVKLATSEMVSAIKQDRVEDLTYTVQDGSVTGHYWKTKKDKGDTSELKSFSSTYVGSDSLAELMAEHPDTKYIVNTNDPDFWGDLAMSVADDRPYRHHVLLYAPDDGRQQQEHAVWQDQRQDQRGHTPQGQV